MTAQLLIANGTRQGIDTDVTSFKGWAGRTRALGLLDATVARV